MEQNVSHATSTQGGKLLISNVTVLNVTGQLVLTEKTREWCKLQYPGHPNGCPNYGMNPQCPPQAPWISDYFDLTKDHWFVVVQFNLGVFSQKMKLQHPNWSDKQTRCCLYWQNMVRKELRKECGEMVQKVSGLEYTLLPEAMGVNVVSTALKLGIPIEVKPETFIHKIALVAFRKQEDS